MKWSWISEKNLSFDRSCSRWSRFLTKEHTINGSIEINSKRTIRYSAFLFDNDDHLRSRLIRLIGLICNLKCFRIVRYRGRTVISMRDGRLRSVELGWEVHLRKSPQPYTFRHPNDRCNTKYLNPRYISIFLFFSLPRVCTISFCR